MFWTLIKSSLNISALRFAIVASCLFFGFIYISLATGPDSSDRNLGAVLGSAQGRLLSTTKLLSEQIVSYESHSESALPQLKPYETILEEVQKESQQRNPKANVLTLMQPLQVALSDYSKAVQSNQPAKARGILLNQIEPANKVLSDVVTSLQKKLIEREANAFPKRWMKFLFYGFAIASLVILPTLLSSGFKYNYEKYLVESLRAPIFRVIANGYLESLDETQKGLKEDISRLAITNIFFPDLENLSSEKKSVFESKIDLSHELEGASAFANLLSNHQSRFDPLPAGVIEFWAQRSLFSYALIAWMYELHKDHHVDRFDLKTEWLDSKWRLTLSTVGVDMHETLSPAYQQVLSKKEGISEKNNSELDYVRTVFRKYTSSYEVNDRGGNLNLILTFDPKGNH